MNNNLFMALLAAGRWMKDAPDGDVRTITVLLKDNVTVSDIVDFNAHDGLVYGITKTGSATFVQDDIRAVVENREIVLPNMLKTATKSLVDLVMRNSKLDAGIIEKRYEDAIAWVAGKEYEPFIDFSRWYNIVFARIEWMAQSLNFIDIMEGRQEVVEGYGVNYP